MTELTAAGALELVRLVRSREVSRREVVEAHLARIDAVNGTVNAIVELREATLAEAEAADADHERRAGLPLDGVPVSIKDHFDVEGMKHTEGVRALASRFARDRALEQGYAPPRTQELRPGREVSGVAAPVDIVVLA